MKIIQIACSESSCGWGLYALGEDGLCYAYTPSSSKWQQMPALEEHHINRFSQPTQDKG
jgi:hypothetical protein